MNALTQEHLKKLLSYNEETGEFTWRVSRGSAKSGSKAGCLHDGYIEIRIDGKNYKAHRLAWLYTHGSWPTSEIDHKYGNRSDNRIAEIREATHAENMKNRGAYKCNKSGFAGVDWKPEKQKWRARIGIDGKQKNIGYFATAEEANAARQNALLRLKDEFRRIPPSREPEPDSPRRR